MSGGWLADPGSQTVHLSVEYCAEADSPDKSRDLYLQDIRGTPSAFPYLWREITPLSTASEHMEKQNEHAILHSHENNI